MLMTRFYSPGQKGVGSLQVCQLLGEILEKDRPRPFDVRGGDPVLVCRFQGSIVEIAPRSFQAILDFVLTFLPRERRAFWQDLNGKLAP